MTIKISHFDIMITATRHNTLCCTCSKSNANTRPRQPTHCAAKETLIIQRAWGHSERVIVCQIAWLCDSVPGKEICLGKYYVQEQATGKHGRKFPSSHSSFCVILFAHWHRQYKFILMSTQFMSSYSLES